MAAFRDYLAVAESNVLDSIAEQSKEKAEALQTKLFPFTFFDRSFDDVMTAVAHFLAFSQSIIQMTWNEDDPNNPTIVRMMLQLVQLAKHRDLRMAMTRAATDKNNRVPWVYHSLFLSFQNLFQQAALLLMSLVATMAIQSTSITQIPFEEFTSFIGTFSFACKELKSMTQVLSVCADSYRTCPDSYHTIGSGFVYRDRPGGDLDRIATGTTDRDKDKEGDTKGWLQLMDKSKRISIHLASAKRFVSITLLKGFAVNSLHVSINIAMVYLHLVPVIRLSSSHTSRLILLCMPSTLSAYSSLAE